ncbi:hypothetical protein Ahy_A07g031380 [Arachis hypogaea]|uniref:Uncharacterized protein n=1 Tax=Arachis hypogaea TaxID=3818 RepID=A0A445C3Q7_ARAHY|nr:hypothetical protein Ahy_A07g031380 [Arachis hypogaea]
MLLSVCRLHTYNNPNSSALLQIQILTHKAKEKRKDTTVTVANFNFDNKDHKKDDPLSFVNVKLDQEQRRILNFVAIDPSHTEDMLSATIMTCLMDWDIDRKLFSVVLDSTAGNDVAIRIGERLSQNRFLYCNGQLFDIRCAASVLHVMVQHALVAISELISKVRESIRYVRSSQTLFMMRVCRGKLAVFDFPYRLLQRTLGIDSWDLINFSMKLPRAKA